MHLGEYIKILNKSVGDLKLKSKRFDDAILEKD